MATTQQRLAALSRLARIATLEARVKALEKALKEARDHLIFCGYGDAYERECAGDLDKRINDILYPNQDAPTN